MGCTSNVFHANKHLDSNPHEYVTAILGAWGRQPDVEKARARPVQLIKVGRAIAAHMRYRMPWRSDPEPSSAASRALSHGWLKRKGDGVVLTERALKMLRGVATKEEAKVEELAKKLARVLLAS